MQKQLGLFGKGIVLIMLVSLPILVLIRNFSPQSGFTKLILFGQKFEHTRLKEITDLAPPTESKWGYDGQFYAQLAINPSLTRSDLETALDNPVYRAKRIGMPLLAFLLGFGKPAWILQIYALLNFAFWLILLAAFYHFIGIKNKRDLLLAISVLWTTGTLTSLARALTDLPAAVLSVLAVFSNSKYVGSAFLGTAALFRETSILSFFSIMWSDQKQKVVFRQLLAYCLIMTLPVMIWALYVNSQMSAGEALKIRNFSVPFFATLQKLYDSAREVLLGFPNRTIHSRIYLLFELLCPLSLVVQSVYFFIKPRIGSRIWRLGSGFAVLLFCLGGSIWVEQFAYCRSVLMLTISFNLLIHEYERDAAYYSWYISGNTGMFYMWFVTVG
jgi:hypothetical protein